MVVNISVVYDDKLSTASVAARRMPIDIDNDMLATMCQWLTVCDAKIRVDFTL